MAQLILVLAIAGVIVWLIRSAPGIDPFFKNAIYAVAIIAVIYYLLKFLPSLGLG